jgi:hypothetical protein
MATAHSIVVHKQEFSRQGQINQAWIRATAGEMHTPAGRSRGAAEPALAGGCDRLAEPIGLAVCLSWSPTRVSTILLSYCCHVPTQAASGGVGRH